MNIFCNSSGEIFHVIPEKIFQGSAGVNKVYFIGQFPSSAQVLMAYTLPNGIPTTPKMLAINKQMEEVQAPNGGKFSVWEGVIGASPKVIDGQVVKDDSGSVVYDLDFTITENYGTAKMQFYVYGASNGVTAGDSVLNIQGGLLATASVNFTIEKGVPVVLPLSLDEDGDVGVILAQILNALANTQTLYENVENVLYGEGGTVDNPTDVNSVYGEINSLKTANSVQNEQIETNAAGIQTNAQAISANAQNIERVEANAIAGYEANKALIDENTSDIEGLRSDIQNEAHFRGYLQTNAEIQALQGTPNDYAYSAESGTVWIYQNGAWVNSGKPVPDQMTPASNTTPLMDGTPSAGQEGAYARGDHRHPTDTSRLAASEKGQANGVASLNASGKVPESQLPPMDYLPLSGGELTGNLEIDGQTAYTGEGATLSGTSLVFAFGATSGKTVAYKVDGVYYTYNGAENVIMLFPTNKSGTQTFAMLSDLASLETQVALHSQIIAQSGLMYTADNVSAWNERVTADGANVLDGSKAVLKKVVGSTVACKQLFVVENITNYYDFVSYDEDKKAYYFDIGVYYHQSRNFYNFNGESGKQYTFSANIDYPSTEKISIVFKYEDGTEGNVTNRVSVTGFARYSATSEVGKTLIGVAWNYTSVPKTMYIKNITLNEGTADLGYQPYFTGLKSASFGGIESTNEDGTKTSMLVFPKTETPLGTTIYFETKKITKEYAYLEQSTPFTEEQLANYTDYIISQDGKSIMYKLETPIVTDFTTQQSASGNEYTADKGGTEKVRENENAEFGANNTMTINYVFVNEV